MVRLGILRNWSFLIFRIIRVVWTFQSSLPHLSESYQVCRTPLKNHISRNSSNFSNSSTVRTWSNFPGIYNFPISKLQRSNTRNPINSYTPNNPIASYTPWRTSNFMEYSDYFQIAWDWIVRKFRIPCNVVFDACFASKTTTRSINRLVNEPVARSLRNS